MINDDDDGQMSMCGGTTLLNPIFRSIYRESDTSLHRNCGRQLTWFDPSGSVATHAGGAFIVNLSPPPPPPPPLFATFS